MRKWSEPKGPPPAWLDAASEITADTPKLGKSEFIAACVDALLGLGLTPRQAFDVTANAIGETGWGQFYRANNLGGWKLGKATADAYKKATGKPIRWWRAPGNRDAGDPTWCYYRAFDSIQDFLRAWCEHFVPKPDAKAPYGAYKACGAAFWEGRDWFPLLIQAGYKGAVTKRKPEGSIRAHHQLADAARTRWAQSKLGVVADGEFGPRSRAACEAFQRTHGLPVTGRPDDATCLALATARTPA